jgi:small-conductance mechanosensitive channel
MSFGNLVKFTDQNNFLISTTALFLIFFTLRLILTSLVRSWRVKDPRNKQTWLLAAKQLPNIILVVGIFIIWGQELRDFALSLVAVAAAIVLATKEVILCFMGGLLKVSTKLFEIDDRIAVAGYRGKVKDHNLMTTELLEIGPGPKSNQKTGKVIKVPNSLFLSNTVSVVPSGNDFILHVIMITLPLEGFDWELVEESLLKATRLVSLTFEKDLESFKKNNPFIAKEFNLDQEPKVFLDLNAKDSVDVSLRLCVPYEGMSRIENEIKKRFVSEYKL